MNRSLLLRVFCIKTFLFQLIICFSTFTSAQNQQDGFFYCRVVSYSQVVSTNVETAKQRISKLVYETDQSLYNSIIFVIPQQVLFSKTKDDVLEFAINEAKKYNLKFFVVVDLLKVFSETKKEWLCKKQNGEIFIPYYLCCGNPEVHSYVRGVVKSFVSIYQIDGIIFENLGYPSKDCSYDSVSLNRFYTRGNLKTLSYEDFQQEQVTKLLTDLYAEIKNYNKNLLVGVFVKDIYKNSSQLKGSYYENFQDVKLWVETNRCDFVVAELKPENIKLQLNDFLKTYPSNKLMFYTQNLIQVEKVFDTVLSRQLFGIVLSSTQAYKLNTKPAFPKVDFNTNIIMGKIQDDNNIGLNDAWISVISEGNEITKTFSSYDGFFSFVNITTQPVNLEFFYPYCKKVIISSITVKENEIKLLEPIIIEGSSEERKKLPLIILRPKDLLSQKPVLHILARTLPENKVEFFSEQTSAKTKVYPTGIFAIDNVKLKLGENLFKFVITDSLGKISSTYFLTISYTTSEVKSIKSVEKEFEVILPKENLMLFTGDVLELKFRGPAKKKIYAVCFDNNEKLFLEEIADGVYYKRYLIPENFSSQSTKLKVCYDYIEQKKYFWGKQKIKTKIFETDVYIEVWNSAYPLIAETNSTKTPLTYGLHYVRLGGPYITELPKGIKLHIVGKQQDKFKVKLSASLSGWVEEKNVNLIRNKENKIPQNYFTSCSVSTTDVF
ncbi:MAG: family 10 glycosylhydrolase, partial [Endomicrobia bacterium]|nr:family 10 glycosylhydrolase [Endomicrobiia bacterium]